MCLAQLAIAMGAKIWIRNNPIHYMYWIDSIVHILLYKHHHFCPRRVPSRRECLETTQKYLHIKSKHWFVCLCTISQTCEWAQFSGIVLKLGAQSWRHYQYIQAHRLVELRVCIPEYWMIHLFDVSRKLFRPLWWEVPNIVCRRLPNLSNIKNSFKILKAFYNKRWCKIRGFFFPPQLVPLLSSSRSLPKLLEDLKKFLKKYYQRKKDKYLSSHIWELTHNLL